MAAKGGFRYLNVWAKHKTFLDVVKEAWERPVHGSGLDVFYRKLMNTRRVLQKWNKDIYCNIFQKVREAEGVMLQRQLQYDTSRDEAALVSLNEARAVYNRELSMECEYWKQKSSIKWMRAGDANTAFFHAHVRQRRNFHFISRIKQEDGQWLEEISQIKDSAVAFFSTLFAAEREGRRSPQLPFQLPKVDQDDNDLLQRLPSLEERKEVVSSISEDSAPGPDGFGAGFYHASWSIICNDLLEAVCDFFRGAQLPRGYTSTLIVLLPKVEGASSWREFRPISLCNVSSKVISKVLSNRLNKLLPKLVSPWQSGFVPGRSIADNILVAQELVADLDRRLKHPNMILKLDMEKAYDRVDWSFLLYMLREFGFKEVNVDLFFRLIANNWFSVLINGEPSGFFRSSRGVRQGDPVSPAMFVLVAEFLGRGLHHLFMQDESRFYVSAGSRVPYLAFADDIFIFFRCSQDALEAIREFFGSYQAMSGQRINVAKSSYLCSNRASADQLALVQSILGFRQQEFPFVYLGAPIDRGRTRVVLFDGILEKLRNRLFHWSSKLLSAGGKIILLRHVLSTIPLYILQVIYPPKAVFVLLGRVCNSFIWDHSLESQRIHWSSWEKLCYPTNEGGIGVRSFEDMAKAFSCKLWWRLRKNDSLWASFMHAKYIQGMHPSLVTFSRPSPIWRRLESVRDFAESKISWCLGRGNIHLWLDRWCSSKPLAQELCVVDPPHQLVSDFFGPSDWNIPLLRQCMPDRWVSSQFHRLGMNFVRSGMSHLLIR